VIIPPDAPQHHDTVTAVAVVVGPSDRRVWLFVLVGGRLVGGWDVRPGRGVVVHQGRSARVLLHFYLWDVDFGPAFSRSAPTFPYPAKIWLTGMNGQTSSPTVGLEFTSSPTGSPRRDPAALQAIL